MEAISLVIILAEVEIVSLEVKLKEDPQIFLGIINSKTLQEIYLVIKEEVAICSQVVRVQTTCLVKVEIQLELEPSMEDMVVMVPMEPRGWVRIQISVR